MSVYRTASDSTVNDIKYFGSATYTVTFSTNDAFIAPDFIDTDDLAFVAIIKNLDGTQLANSIDNNEITCTGTCSDAECTVFVFGVRAT
jgi:hypothetical protein